MNTGSILLAYATRYGSTQEVAEAIAAELREAGLAVDVQVMRDVQSVARYDAVVLGAAVYSTRWHPDAHDFLSRHRETLQQRPVAIFALGPLSTDDAAMLSSRRQLEKDLKKYPWLKPVAREMFVGRQRPSGPGLFGSPRPAADNRDWDAIRHWAGALAASLKTEVTAPAGA